MCHYLFFREVHRGKEWVCRWSYLLGEIMVVWGLYQAFLSRRGGGILCVYIGKDEYVGVIFVAVRMCRLELIGCLWMRGHQ